jgi:hypothetical protein
LVTFDEQLKRGQTTLPTCAKSGVIEGVEFYLSFNNLLRRCEGRIGEIRGQLCCAKSSQIIQIVDHRQDWMRKNYYLE